MKRLRKKLILLIIFGLINNKILAKDNFTLEVSSNRTTEVLIKQGMVTTIKFPEKINFFVLGDELVADITIINNYTLALNSKLADKQTNLNVNTKKNNYVFLISTIDYENNRNPILHIEVSESNGYSFFNLFKKEEKQENEELDYEFSMRANWFGDHKKIAPNKVWSDGEYTYLDYRTEDGAKDIPTVLEVVDYIDTPVNFTIKENVIVVHTLAEKLTLKAGGKWVCIDYKGTKYAAKK